MIVAPGSMPASIGYGLMSCWQKPWIVVQVISSRAALAAVMAAR